MSKPNNWQQKRLTAPATQPQGWTLPAAARPAVFEFCPEGVNTVWVQPTALAKMKMLHENTRGEWLAYLSGHFNARGEPVITDLRVPPQQASSSHVDVTEWVPDANHLGVMHSHHDLKCSFSGTDHQYINGNHRLSVLLNTDRLNRDWGFKLEAQYRAAVSCGRQLVQSPTVKLLLPEADNALADWLADSLPQIKQATIVSTGYQQGYIWSVSERRYVPRDYTPPASYRTIISKDLMDTYKLTGNGPWTSAEIAVWADKMGYTPEELTMLIAQTPVEHDEVEYVPRDGPDADFDDSIYW